MRLRLCICLALLFMLASLAFGGEREKARARAKASWSWVITESQKSPPEPPAIHSGDSRAVPVPPSTVQRFESAPQRRAIFRRGGG